MSDVQSDDTTMNPAVTNIEEKMPSAVSHFQTIADELRQRELQLSAITANLPGILYRVVLHADGTIDFPYVSPNTLEVAGRQPEEHWMDRIHPDDRADFFNVLHSCAEQLLPFDLEQRVMSVPNQQIWVRNITRPHRGADGAVVWDGMILDITAQKRVEQDLQNSLREKEALLQEVHHRVKNNLQIISSLLDLQALSLPEPQAQAVFIEAQRRIRAIALVHDQLYNTETMAQIDFAAYVRTLIDYLQQSFLSEAAHVTIEIAIDSILMDANAAIPLGLIINELVTNAFKHAFPQARTGTIRIACSMAENHQTILSVADNGIGLPAPVDRKLGVLGLKLVGTLTRQLHGSLTLENRNGTVATVTFTRG